MSVVQAVYQPHFFQHAACHFFRAVMAIITNHVANSAPLSVTLYSPVHNVAYLLEISNNDVEDNNNAHLRPASRNFRAVAALFAVMRQMK